MTTTGTFSRPAFLIVFKLSLLFNSRGLYYPRTYTAGVLIRSLFFCYCNCCLSFFFPTITRLSRKKPDAASVDCEHMTTEEADDDRPASTNHAPAPYLRRL